MINNRLAVITGAAGGIGKELALVHAAMGGDLMIAARSRKGLMAVKSEAESVHDVTVHVVEIDLAEPSGPERSP